MLKSQTLKRQNGFGLEKTRPQRKTMGKRKREAKIACEILAV